MRLPNRVALVTGAGPGIGRAIPLLFAREGAQLALVDIRTDAAEETAQRIRSAGGDALVIQADVALADDWARAVEETVGHFGRLDVLVNGAAANPRLPILELDESEWDRALAVTLKSVYLGARASIPEMLKIGRGAIVNISSVNALISNPRFGAYSAAKAGVGGLTRNLAIDYGLKGIRVNAICPGMIVNETTEPVLLSDAEEAESVRDPYLVGRWGYPEDVAYAALYLASDEATFVTGIELVVDGGLTCQSPEATGRRSFRRA